MTRILLLVLLLLPSWVAAANKTVTVKTTGGDYTNLNAAFSGESGVGDRDLVTNQRILTIELYNSNGTNGADTTAASQTEVFTVSSSYYFNIVVPTANRHSGAFDTSKYHMGDISGTSLQINESYTRLTGMQSIKESGSGGSIVISNSAFDITGVIIDSFLGRTRYTSSGIVNIQVTSDTGTNHVVNSISIVGASGQTTAGSALRQRYNGTLNIYSCTLVAQDDGTAISRTNGTGTTTVKNTYGAAVGSGTAFGTTTKTNCASDDTSAGTSNGCLSNIAFSTSSGGYFTNVTSGSENLHIASASSSLYNAGTDTSGSTPNPPLGFTTDIDRDSRPQSTAWDIGADELVAGGGGGSTSLPWLPAVMRNQGGIH